MPYATNDAGNRDGLYQNYSIEPYDGVWRLDSAKATVWCIQKARSFGTKILMTPWSPPEWMKTNNSVYSDGSLRSDMKDKFATYLAKNLRFFDSSGANIDFFSMQNEALQARYWQSCLWGNDDYYDVLKNHVKPTFETYNLHPKILFNEGKNWNEANQFMASLQDSALRNWIYAGANHPYDDKGEITAPTIQTSQYKIPQWQSEYDDISYVDRTMAGWSDYFRKIVQGFIKGNISAWLLGKFISPDRWLATDGLLDPIYWHDDANDLVIKQKSAYGFGQFSKYIRPGMVRISSGSYGDNNIFVMAFKDLITAKKIIVVVNGNATSQNINFNCKGFVNTQAIPTVTDSSKNMEKGNVVNLINNYSLSPFAIVTFVVEGNLSATKPLQTHFEHKSPPLKFNGKKIIFQHASTNTLNFNTFDILGNTCVTY